MTADGTILYVNEAFCRYFGKTEKTLIGHTWNPLAFQDDVPLIQAMLARLSPELPYVTIENRVINAQGELRWGQFTNHAVFDLQGNLIEMQSVGRDVTDRKLAEIALRESEERLSLAQTAAHIGIWDWNLETNVTGFNDEYYALLGLPQGVAHTYENFLDRVHPDDRSRLNTAFQSSLAGAAPYDVEFRIVREQDQVVRWMHDKGKILFDDNGRPLRAMGITYDITERVEAAEKLREREQWLTALLEHSATIAFIKDEEGHHIFVSPNFEKRFDLRREDWLGKADHEIWPKEMAEEYRRNDLAVLNSGRSHEILEPTPNPDGSTSWWRSSKFAFSDPAGNRYVGGLAVDVTDIKDAERRLRDSEERFRAVFDSAGTGIGICDAVGNIELCNPTYCALLGYTEAELRQLNFIDLVHPDDRAANLALIQPLTDGELPCVEIENRYVRKDGRPIWVRTFITRLTNSTATPAHLVAMVTDMTERRQLEEALREADRRKDEFLATLAHELRNPLAPIRLGLGILRHASEDPKTLIDTLDVLDRQVLLMIRLIDELLDISRITSGKIKLQESIVELSSVIQHAAEISRPLIKESGHTLHFELPEKPILVNADLVRLGQAFANLLNNAAKFTPQGGSIAVHVEQRKDTVEVRVLDNGIGIPAAMIPRIFDIFTQADQSLEKQYGGLGIGLTLVKELVTLHGGSVEARSEGEGKGSEFIVRLPCEAPSEAPDRMNDQELATKVDVNRRILICDDNLSLTKFLSMSLKLMGHQVTTANDGLEAVKLAETCQPELIILDIGMPNLNGYDACRQIRQQPWGRDIFITALTGWGTDSDRERAKDAGFDHYLVKPVGQAELENLINLIPEHRAR